MDHDVRESIAVEVSGPDDIGPEVGAGRADAEHASREGDIELRGEVFTTEHHVDGRRPEERHGIGGIPEREVIDPIPVEIVDPGGIRAKCARGRAVTQHYAAQQGIGEELRVREAAPAGAKRRHGQDTRIDVHGTQPRSSGGRRYSTGSLPQVGCTLDRRGE